MFVRDYLELPLPPGRVKEALLGSPAWLPELAGEAQRHGEGLLAEVGVGPPGVRPGHGLGIGAAPRLRAERIGLSRPRGPATMRP